MNRIKRMRRDGDKKIEKGEEWKDGKKKMIESEGVRKDENREE